MSQNNITVLPQTGLISVKDLAKYLDIGTATLIQALTDNNVPYIKLSKYHNHWLIRLEELKSGGIRHDQ